MYLLGEIHSHQKQNHENAAWMSGESGRTIKMARGCRFHSTQNRALLAALALCVCAPVASAQSLFGDLAVVPVLVGPLQTLIAILPGLAVAFFGALVALFKPSTAVKFFKLLWAQKIPVTILVAVIAGAWWGLPKAFPNWGGGTAQAAKETYDMFRGGPTRRGWSKGSGVEDPTEGGRNWAFQDNVTSIFCSPAAVGDYLYFASAEMGNVFGGTDGTGNLFCLNAKTGEKIWTDQLSNYRATYSSPAVSGKYLVCGEGLHYCKDARVVCLDSTNGKTLWEYRTKSHVESSACIYDGKAYIGAGDDGMYCIALEPNPDGTPNIKWHLDGKEYPDCEASPVALDGKVYMGLGLGGQGILCLDAETGKKIWHLKTDYPVFGSPSISGDKLFVGMGTGNMVMTAEQAWSVKKMKLVEKGVSDEEIAKQAKQAGPVGEVWCIDLKAKKKAWSYKVGRGVLGAVAVGKDRVFFGSRDAHLYCLSFDGKLIGKWNAQSAMVTSPTLAKDHVYVATTTGMVYGLDAQSLELKWEASLWAVPPGPLDMFMSSPVVANGHLYAGSAKDGMLCLGKPGKRKEPVWSGYLGGSGLSGRADRSPIPSSMTVAWTLPAADAKSEKPLTFGAAPAYISGALYLPFTEGEQHGLMKLTVQEDGGKPAVEAWRALTKQPVLPSIAAKGELVFVVEGPQGQDGRRLVALKAADGKEEWSKPVAAQADGGLLLLGDQLLLSIEKGVTALGMTGEKAGKKLWSYAEGLVVGAPAASAGRVAVAMKNPDRVAILDGATGLPLYVKELQAPPLNGPVLEGERLCVPTEKGVSVISVLETEEPKLLETGKVEKPLILIAGKMAALSADDNLHLIDLAEAKILKSQSSTKVLPFVTRDGLFRCSRRGYQKFPLDGSNVRPETWMRTSKSKVGTVQSPVVFAGSRAYFVSTKGLVCAQAK